MRSVLGGIAISATLGLCACDVGSNVRIYNGTGRDLDMPPTRYANFKHVTHLKPGATGRIMTPGSALRLAQAGCEHSYILPEMLLNYPWNTADGHDRDYDYPYPVNVQVEPDFTLYLLPAGDPGLKSLEALQREQAHGFPVKPISTSCR